MNEFEIGAAVLAVAILPCIAVCSRASIPSGLAAMELAAVLMTTILMLLSEGFRRQSFVDLAVVFAPLSLVGSLTFARLLERHL
ncbi:MAG: monovalent cation/H+ antiporter complex subunit F [Solirubrobacteraceae bacterium]